ncbi:MAG TPA: hypothetical protein VF414_19360 [Thermoanaerobaculia bacterium]
MSTIGMPMPGALRWRALHPLIDGDGTCSLIYDLERAAVLEVPEELQLHVATALETGDPDDALLSWMVGEDLITMDGWQDWLPDGQRMGAGAPEPWSSGLGMFFRLEGEAAHVGIAALPEESALGVLELGFRQAFGAPRVQVHLDWDGRLPGAGLVERIVAEAGRIAADAGQEVSFDLALDAREVTPAVALFLSSLPVHVRLRCGAFPGGEAPIARETERALLFLWMEDLADRITLGFTLAGYARLRELWSWARRLGVRHLDAVRLPEDGDAWLRDFESDLRGIAEDVSRDLEARVIPVDFRPLTRIVRRLQQSEPQGLLQEEGLTDCCSTCWARRLCRNSAALVSESEAEPRTPGSCAVWRAEAEAALRLYHRLAQADPLQVLRAFGNPCSLFDELPAGPVMEAGGPKAPC